ncbi:MIEAP domain-containing protein [Trichonephila clavata]|uniref:Mitochondria-eating protein n=2 Tax=Nephilidae TaxID=450948 RepID=A0A8X6F6M0_TRICU|nr:MIEAP domain-containing protein [Trichonephila clavata]
MISCSFTVRFGNRNRSNRSTSSSSDNQSLTGEGSSVSSAKQSFQRHFEILSEGVIGNLVSGSRCSSRVESSSMDCRTLCKVPSSPVPSTQMSTSTHSSAVSQDSWKVAALRREVSVLKAELNQSRLNIEFLQQRERKMKERLAEQARLMLDRGIRFENVALGERRPTALIRRYGNLYAQSRVDTLDALDCIPELEHAHDLKSKILFSAVVLSFRSVYHTICEIRSRIKHILQISEDKERSSDSTVRDLDLCISTYMKNSVERFDLRKNLEEVLSQIWATLYDYPSLKTCEGLKHYVKDCVRLAWSLSNQYPPFVIEYEGRVFRKDLHVRFHSSNQESDHIKTYLWPTLLEGRNGPCVHKGVVIT